MPWRVRESAGQIIRFLSHNSKARLIVSVLNAKAWRCGGFEIHYRYNVSRTTAGLGVLTNPNAAVPGGFGEWAWLPPSRRHRPDSFWMDHEPLFTADGDFGE